MAERLEVNSQQAYSRALRLMPGGVSSPVRAFGAVGGIPRFVSHGTGAHIFDIDGNRYIDMCGSWGPLILGHAHPVVVEAIARAARNGSSFGAPTQAESDLAERIIDAVPSIEQVRFTSSGTEAAMSALRLARAHTGRTRIIKTAGGYHGHSDALLVETGSGALTQGQPNSAGVTRGSVADTSVIPFNDPEALATALIGNDVAAVIMEPIAANMGVVPPVAGYLEQVRALTREHGTLLIFDEVVTGFRVALGGAQALYEVTPDITILGKIIGGGMPLGAYGSSSQIMSNVAPVGAMYQAGTLSGNPISVAAGIATLDVLTAELPYARLESMGIHFEETVRSRSATVHRVGSMLTVFFHSGPVIDLETAKKSDKEAFASWFHDLLEAGVWWPPSQFEAAFLNTSMTDADVNEVARIAAAKTTTR